MSCQDYDHTSLVQILNAATTTTKKNDEHAEKKRTNDEHFVSNRLN